MNIELTEEQRSFLYYLVQCDIDDKETWLEFAENEDTKDSIKLRLDALWKLRDFIAGCGKQEGGQA